MYVYYTIAAISILVFLHGFFPIPARTLPKFNTSNSTSNPKFDKTVIIVIDALRLDFISEDKTPFVWRTYHSTGCYNELKVENPTVTLPRIKALTTGNVPQFVDVILNLANPATVDDSFVHRAHVKNKKLVFYGDDIWLKLFPGLFERSEGVSSFFVNDYTEVDANVTRNVVKEMKRSDWDIMILHYLGLDHIGHVFGPKSPLILTKLKEMDNIIEEMYTSTKGETLFIITGDHGMRDSGGHGGSTFPETHVPLVVLGMSCSNGTFAQIDFPSNLAVLLDFDIPATSIGQLQSNLLQNLSTSDYLKALKSNTFLLRGKLDLCQENIETAIYFHDLYLLNNKQELAQSAAEIYINCCKKIGDRLLKTSIHQNIGSLVISTLMAGCVILKILYHLLDSCKSRPQRLEQGAMLVILGLQFIDLHLFVSVALAGVTILFCLRIFTKNLAKANLSFLSFMSVIHPLIFLSSSFLEEEHQFWYFFTNTFIFFNLLNSKDKITWIFIFVVLRFLRIINQVGDKWASYPDLADWFLQNENYLYLQAIFVIGLVLTFYSLVLIDKKRFNFTLNVIVLLSIFLYRTISNEQISIGKFVWSMIFLKLLYCKVNNDHFVPVWVLIITLLLKPYNVILIPFCILCSRYYQKSLHDPQSLVMAHWWLGNLLFFSQGHDNSLASVDISSGYVGLSDYEPLLVFPQVLFHTYAFPVLTNLLLFQMDKIHIFEYLPLFVMLRLYVVVFVFIVTFIHRHHLFIWSVFAPKMIVESSHFGFLFFQITCFYINNFFNKFIHA